MQISQQKMSDIFLLLKFHQYFVELEALGPHRFVRHHICLVKLPHPDFLRKFTSNSSPPSSIIPTYITICPFSVGNLQRTKSPIFGSSLSQYLRLISSHRLTSDSSETNKASSSSQLLSDSF